MWSDIQTRVASHRQAASIGLVGLLAVLAVIVIWLASNLAGQGGDVGAAPSPTGSAVLSPSVAPTAEPTSTPAHETPSSPRPTPRSMAEGWVEIASFGSDDGIESVNDVVQAPFGLLAGGVQIDTRALPVFGPLPKEGRIWRSADDGQSWEDVTPPETFANAEVDDLVVLPDGAVLAVVAVQVSVDGYPDTDYVLLETTDGRTWTDADINAGSALIYSIEAGGRGYLATINADLGEPNLLYSSDGRNYQPTRPPTNGRIITALAAGPEGFVAFGSVYESAEPPVAYASADGLTWYESAPFDWYASHLAPVGPDWVGFGIGSIPEATEEDARTTFSENGLEWSDTGAVPMRTVELDPTTSCREYLARAIGGGDFVVAATDLSGPCGEGHVQRFGAAHISSDSDNWEALPFTTAPIGIDITVTRGATVNDGIELGSGRLLVGEKDYRATFWFRPND
jgi:hypothetical protein